MLLLPEVLRLINMLKMTRLERKWAEKDVFASFLTVKVNFSHGGKTPGWHA